MNEQLNEVIETARQERLETKAAIDACIAIVETLMADLDTLNRGEIDDALEGIIEGLMSVYEPVVLE